MNIVLSPTAAATLPPVTPAVTTGDTPVTVTQMKDTAHVNGMGYFVQLADGSFIVFDGAYSDQSRRLVKAMKELCPEGEKPLVRAWVLSHSHDDHWPTFSQIAKRQTSDITVEYVIFSPIDPDVAVAENGDTYFNTDVHEDIAKFGAKTVYAHTGMEFTFCNLKMEVLLSSDDIYKDNVSHGAWFFNNSSTVVRLYDESYSFLVMGDIGKVGAELMLGVYGDYLKSDMIQMAHHGVEDVPVAFYEVAQGSILFYPCSQWLYDQTDRHYDVRKACEEMASTKEILISQLGQFTRAWGTSFEADAPLSVPDHPTGGILGGLNK
jgi:L-ascorbate metabolism protein UlaG (beta-lactamase superfamily)